jgi:putative acetyltransferase
MCAMNDCCGVLQASLRDAVPPLARQIRGINSHGYRHMIATRSENGQARSFPLRVCVIGPVCLIRSMTPPETVALTIEAADPIGEVARGLIHDLCAEMSERYGAPPSPFSPSEAAMPRTVFLVARLSGQPVGCSALRRFDDDTAEIKRMYVAPGGRRKGIARRILVELERHAREFGYCAIRLETGIRQPEAQRLYESLGYRRIDAFGPYIGNPTSICYERVLHDSNSAAERVSV